MPGKIAIISRSGTLCYETVGSTTKVGLGQSTVIGIGGDRLPGTNYVDALRMLSDDPTTEGTVFGNQLTIGIILIGEVGGKSELTACQYIKKSGLDQRK
jgi:succinyl-CoA synthetase alpha subunit